jgi:PIN domain nuclease of toxin-antitoxin system
MFHNDPFDRILIAQTITEKLTLITSDEKIKKYNIPVLFAK